jgi:hypothetical protein
MKPGIPKRHLLLVAAGVWLFAGGFLLFRGIRLMPDGIEMLWLKILGSVFVGILFFHLLFLRISLRHIHRIASLEILKPCIFSFFDWKSYLIMAVMITAGVLVRKTGWISPEWISLFFILMAIPLLLSAIRFLRAYVNYEQILKPHNTKEGSEFVR